MDTKNDPRTLRFAVLKQYTCFHEEYRQRNSLDPDVDMDNFEDKRQIARVNVQPDNNRGFHSFPRVL